MATTTTTTENSFYANLKYAIQNGNDIEENAMHDNRLNLTLDELVPMCIEATWRNEKNAEIIASNKQFVHMHQYQLLSGTRMELQNVFVLASGHGLENTVKLSIASVDEPGILMAGLVPSVTYGHEKIVKIISEHKLFDQIPSLNLNFLIGSAKENKFEKIVDILSGQNLKL